jgi:hypothetical protein
MTDVSKVETFQTFISLVSLLTPPSPPIPSSNVIKMAQTQDNSALFSGIAKAADQYPKPAGVTYTYGTAGFRML